MKKKIVRLFIGDAVVRLISSQITTKGELILYPENFLNSMDSGKLILDRIKNRGDLTVFSQSPNVIEMVYKATKYIHPINENVNLIIVYQKFCKNGRVIDVNKRTTNVEKLLELWFEEHNKVFDVFDKLENDHLARVNKWDKKEDR